MLAHRCFLHIWRGAVFVVRGRGMCAECFEREGSA